MVRYKINDQLDPIVMKSIPQLFKFVKRSEMLVCGKIVTHMIPVKTCPTVITSVGFIIKNLCVAILIRRRNPDGSNSHSLQIRDLVYDASPVATLVKLLSTAAGSVGMCGGQAVDLLSVHQKLDLDTLTLMHRLKTGAMIRASALMGLYAAKEMPPAALIGQIIQYADAIGLAFQVIDDILDVTADTKVLGKTAGKDAAEDKPTYVSILGLEQSRTMAQNEINKALQALETIEQLAQNYQGKTVRLAEIAQYILSRDH